LESILDLANDGVLIVDHEDRIVLVSQAFRENLDLKDATVDGKAISKVTQNAALLDALKTAGERHELQNHQGRIFQVRITRLPETGTLVSLHDISALKEIDRKKGDFVNTVSHDLRSPLTAILGYVELIERTGSVNEQQIEFIKRVKNSVHTTTNLIDDLLKLGRVEVGTLDELVPVNLKLLIVNAMANLQLQIQEKKQTVRLDKSYEMPAIIGSRAQLNQMVDNLIGNAVKYTPDGGEITVTLIQEENQLIMNVTDSGPGIPLEEQGRIFEKFYRASNAPEDVSGTGLGLAIVKNIVDNHHGRIWVNSKPGEGAAFTVVLPIRKEG
jgi:two-component system NtrC family sensor kinase